MYLQTSEYPWLLSNMHMAEWKKSKINTAFDFAIRDVQLAKNGLHSIRKIWQFNYNTKTYGSFEELVWHYFEHIRFVLCTLSFS